jgi:hypothetical protein
MGAIRSSETLITICKITQNTTVHIFTAVKTSLKSHVLKIVPLNELAEFYGCADGSVLTTVLQV